MSTSKYPGLGGAGEGGGVGGTTKQTTKRQQVHREARKKGHLSVTRAPKQTNTGSKFGD